MRSRYDRFVGFLYSHPAMRAGNFEGVVRLTTETAVRALRVPRAEIWLLRDGRLENGDTFSRETASHACLPSVDAAGDERLSEDLPGGGAFSGGTTRMFFALRGDGVLAGLLGVVRDSGRPWTDAETSFCASLAGLVGLAFDIAVRREAIHFDENRAVPSMTFRYSPGTLEFQPTAPEGCLELTGYPVSAFLQDRELFFRSIVSPADLAKFTSMERTKSGRLQADILFSGERRDGASRRFWFRGCRAKDDVGGVPVIEGAITDVTHLYASDGTMENGQTGVPRSEQSAPPGAGRVDMLLLRSPGGDEENPAWLRRAAGILLNPADESEKNAMARVDCESCGYDVLPWLFGVVDAIYLRAMGRKVRLLANVAPDIPQRLIGNRAGLGRVVGGLLDSVVRLTSGESVLFEVDGESTDEGYRLHFGIVSTGADDRTKLSAVFSAGRRLLERMGGEVHAERDAGPGFEVRFSAPRQSGTPDASAVPGVASGKSLLILHESPILLNHLKDLCCGLGVQSRFCSTWAELERVLSGGRFTHVLCSVRTEEDIARLDALRGRRAERGDLFCRFSACADAGTTAEKIPSDVVLLVEPLLPEAIARFLNGEYYCAREPDAVVPTLSLPLPTAAPERPENDLLKRLRALEFLRSDKALQRLANDADLYISLLEAFREDISRSCDVLLGAMQREDRKALALECHTMKISLRTIGAESLGEEAERLEMEENNGGAEQKLYFSFIASLEKLGSRLDAVFKAASRASLSESELQDKLRDFREALSFFDIQRLRALADEIASGVGGRSESQVMELRKCLDLLDYEAAEKILQELVTRKGPSWKRN